MVGVYFYVLKGDALFEENKEDALDERAELFELISTGLHYFDCSESNLPSSNKVSRIALLRALLPSVVRPQRHGGRVVRRDGWNPF